MAIELYPHQLTAQKELSNGKILEGGVGTGKSRTALAYYYLSVCQGGLKINGVGDWVPMKRPKHLVVITTAKKRDSLEWEQEAVSFGLARDVANSMNGVTITVDSWNNIVNYTEVKDAFFIFDEQRLVGSGAWVKAFIKLAQNNEWILLSATPGDTWLDYIPVFLAHGFYKSRRDFFDQHVVLDPYTKFPKVKRYVNTEKLSRLRHSLLVEMPYLSHTHRNAETILVEHDKALYDRVAKDRWNIFTDEPCKDVGELLRVMRGVVNRDPDRLGAVIKLTEKHPKLIVFYNFTYELEALRTLGATLGTPTAEWNGQKHQPIPETDRWLYLVQYTAGAEGWNCIETNAIAFYSLNYSWRIMEQSKGRIDRLNTPFVELYYYLLRSNSSIDTMIWKALTLKQNFNEKKFYRKQYGDEELMAA